MISETAHTQKDSKNQGGNVCDLLTKKQHFK